MCHWHSTTLVPCPNDALILGVTMEIAGSDSGGSSSPVQLTSGSGCGTGSLSCAATGTGGDPRSPRAYTP
jgi:hypothetical protein